MVGVFNRWFEVEVTHKALPEKKRADRLRPTRLPGLAIDTPGAGGRCMIPDRRSLC